MSDDRSEADVAFIRALADLLKDSDLGEIEVKRDYGEDDALKVRLSRYGSAVSVMQPGPAVQPAAMPQQPLAAQQPGEPAVEREAPASTDRKGVVPSPMVGTVYLAPEPGAAPFVTVGDTVAEGQTLLIIEAMKTMNQIAAPRAGVLTEMLVEDAEPVEFGSPLLVIA